MDRQRSTFGHWGTVEARINPLAINAVTAFVGCAEEGRGDIILQNPGGDAHITDADILGEGMSRFILAPVIPIVTIVRNHFNAKFPLVLLIEILVQERVINLLACADGTQQINLARPKSREDGLNIRGQQFRFIIVEQGIIDVIKRLKVFGILAL